MAAWSPAGFPHLRSLPPMECSAKAGAELTAKSNCIKAVLSERQIPAMNLIRNSMLYRLQMQWSLIMFLTRFPSGKAVFAACVNSLPILTTPLLGVVQWVIKTHSLNDMSLCFREKRRIREGFAAFLPGWRGRIEFQSFANPFIASTFTAQKKPVGWLAE